MNIKNKEPQYFHVSYDFIDNGAGELMIVMDAPDYETEADDENAKFIYDGFAEAMIIRNSEQIVHLPILVEHVRDMLNKIEIILVTEMNGDEMHNVYEAKVEVLNKSLPIPKSAYENMFKRNVGNDNHTKNE